MCGLIGKGQKRVARAIRLRRMTGMWGCPPQHNSPFSWPGEGGQVVDSTRRGDEVDHVAEMTAIACSGPLDDRWLSRMATPSLQSTGMYKRRTPESE